MTNLGPIAIIIVAAFGMLPAPACGDIAAGGNGSGPRPSAALPIHIKVIPYASLTIEESTAEGCSYYLVNANFGYTIQTRDVVEAGVVEEGQINWGEAKSQASEVVVAPLGGAYRGSIRVSPWSDPAAVPQNTPRARDTARAAVAVIVFPNG